ncbi:MAG: hypothetical protein OXE50_08660 [Chloroflexi bacterium]|nr:hypothetical protein [Chloroflexota bacterium]
MSQIWWFLAGLRILFEIDYAGGIEANFRELKGIPPSVEQQLGAVGLNEPLLDFVTHVVVRATFLPGTERCTSEGPVRAPLYDEVYFAVASYFGAVQCFADVRVNSYILGKGSPRLTVQTGLYLGITETLDYLNEGFEGEEAISEEEFLEGIRQQWETAIVHGDVQAHYATGSGPPTSFTRTGGIRGKEVILFLGPSINPATEAWQVFETWDVQRKVDGTVVAVHPHSEAWRISNNYSSAVHGPLLEVELPRFRKEVMEASQARLEAFDGRIGMDATLPMLVFDTNDLEEFMASTGAYDHPDGPPAQPPPVSDEDDRVPDVIELPVLPTPAL